MLQITVVQIVEAGMCTNKSSIRDRPDQEQRRGRAVVGAPGCVLQNPASELTECQERHAVTVARRAQIVVKRADRIRKLKQQGSMSSKLVGMRVKPIERCVEDSRAEIRLDDLGNQLQPLRQPVVRILGAPLPALGKLLKAAA